MKKRIMAVILVLSILLCASACGKVKLPGESTTASATDETTTYVQPRYSAAPDTVKKSETVYVSLSPDGKSTGITVTDWLHTDRAQVRVEDISLLKGITNVKGLVEPIINKESVVWNMDTTDLYYSGKTDKAVPVSFDIKYSLNGKTISPEQAAGKSGKIKIDITMKNNDERKIKIDGKTTTVYNPFIVVGGFMMPEEGFSNITLVNGRSIGDGSKQIALLIGMPGMNESLRLDELDIDLFNGLDLSGKFSVTADVTDFAMGNMFFAALPISSLDLGLTMPENIDEAKEILSVLDDITAALGDMNISDIVSSALTDTNRLVDLTKAVSDALKLYQSNRVLIDLAEKYMTEENIASLKKILGDLDSEQIKEVTALFSNPVVRLFIKNLPTLIEDARELTPMLEQMAKDMEDPKVAAAIQQLPETLDTLMELKDVLSENEELLKAVDVILSDDNLNTITAILDKVSAKLKDVESVDKYAALTGNANALINRLSAWLKVGNEYRIYTEAPDTMDTSVMFIFKTSGIG